ncbi:MAG: hypothetical protein JWO87_3093 [Phycisphaerales bacterium]|nr:hypothetical protein [Phycisphaerales bacterium]
MLRRIVLNAHIYGGLICFSYLILFGISILNFNHPFPFTKSPASVATWSRPMALPALARTDGRNGPEALKIRRQNNSAILHALGSFAGPSTDGDWIDADTYHAHFMRPGKEYEIDVHPGQGSATIRQTRMNFWALIRDLHGSSVVYPDSILASTWAWYTEICTYVVVVAGISGVYLWSGRRRERRIGLVLLGAAGMVSLSLMLLITFHG